MGKFDGILIACDIDNTLLDDKKRIPFKNVSAVEYFIANGGRFTLATGRTGPPLVEKFFNKIAINAPGVCSNGAQIYDFEKDRSLWLDPISKESVIEFVKHFKDEFPHIAIEIVNERDTYVFNKNELCLFHESAEGFKFIESDIDEIPGTWIKLMLAQEESRLDYGVDYILNEWKFHEKRTDIRFVRSAPFFLEMLGADVSKGKALRLLKDMLKVETAVAIGDGLNDIEMLHSADMSFAPIDGCEEAKEAATRVVGSYNLGAVSDVIEYLDTVY